MRKGLRELERDGLLTEVRGGAILTSGDVKTANLRKAKDAEARKATLSPTSRSTLGAAPSSGPQGAGARSFFQKLVSLRRLST